MEWINHNVNNEHEKLMQATINATVNLIFRFLFLFENPVCTIIYKNHILIHTNKY